MPYLAFISPSHVSLSASAFPVRHGKDLKLWTVEIQWSGGWGRGLFGKPTLKLNNFVYIPEDCMCPITFCNYKCINISPFTSSAVFYIFTCNESE